MLNLHVEIECKSFKIQLIRKSWISLCYRNTIYALNLLVRANVGIQGSLIPPCHSLGLKLSVLAALVTVCLRLEGKVNFINDSAQRLLF